MNTLIETPPQSITLYYREGSSDKVYQAGIEPAGGLFVVNFAYGRRGSTLNVGTKTAAPVDYLTARRIYEKLVREKLAKGYTPGPEGTPYQQTNHEQRQTGILPQLLNPIDADEAVKLLADDSWCLQEKIDGRRVLIDKAGDRIVAINRKGLAISLPTPIIVEAAGIPGDFTLDGECVGDNYHAFDLLEREGEDYRPLSLKRRLVELHSLLATAQCPHLELVPTAYEMVAKQRLYDEFKTTNKEGAVFKCLDAPYTAGRPNSGGPALKHKFTATLSAVVSLVNPQRSVEFRLLGKDGWQVAGNVTIPANHQVPKPGEVIEVRYLYAFAESGVLFQPVYLGPRSDLEPTECKASQLKFKTNQEDEP
jgi:bifunctional non-homologous end joining protein LigD